MSLLEQLIAELPPHEQERFRRASEEGRLHRDGADPPTPPEPPEALPTPDGGSSQTAAMPPIYESSYNPVFW